MTTIPIEVIVQDPSDPITPTPETHSTETNIVVPDTGAGTISNVSAFSSSSVASIIAPVVLLALALVTICTLLIHRHRKHQDSKASKKEKLAASASATIAALSATVLVGNLILPATKAATSDSEVSIEVPDKISIVVNREDDTTEATTEATAYITSTAAFGYKVLLSMADGVDTANLYLNGDNTSTYYIAPVEGEELSVNTWGYALADEEDYSAVPLVDDAALALKGYYNVVDKETTIDYGVRVDKDLPVGTYMGEIEYVTVNAIEYMQDFADLSTEDKSSVLASMTEDQQYYLKDNRDNKTYRIAKLKDGNVWMTQNLDLQKEDLLEGMSINNNNTDNPIASFILPDSQISGNESWGGDEAAYNTAHVYDPSYDETKYYYCTNFSFGPGCLEYGDEEVPVKEFGNYYNWYTATAGTGTYDLAMEEVAPGSICPAGWKLPSGAKGGNVTNYSNLFYEYGILPSFTSSDNISNFSALFEEPLLFTQGSGSYYNGLVGVGIHSYFWTSTSYGSLYGDNEAWQLGISPNYINPWSYGSKTNGFSVRCLAR